MIQQLTYLAVLAREQHFGRAAQACHVAQPTLSAGIQSLEAELGVPLVRRSRRYEGLTPEGERMLDWAHRVLADVGAMRADAGALREGLVGRLRIGAIPTSLPIVSLLTAPLCRRHPELDLSVTSTTSREIEAGLRDARLDVGLTYLDNEPLRGVRSRALYDERYLYLVPEHGPHAGARSVGWTEIAGERLCLLSPDMQHRRILDRIFRDVGVAPRPVIETNSITTLFAHVRDGLAAGVMPHTWLHLFGPPEGMQVIPLRDPVERHTIGAVWLDRDPEPLLVRAFVDATNEAELEVLVSG
jgi:DNA-binding transcriptional LysR family regulator